jgi:GNAT superfamily N-acetyltransferase
MSTFAHFPLDKLHIRPFAPSDQAAAKALILAGLEERWGRLDLTLNPDLNAIAHHYAAGCFLVAEQQGVLVGTGALLPEDSATLRVVRMSVARKLRGQGIGRAILAALLAHARQVGGHQVVLETTATWTDAVRFYRRAGFQMVDERDGDIHMVLPLG